MTLTTEEETKLVPLTVTVAELVAPMGSADGLKWMVPGAGLLTGSVAAADVPPPGAEFTAVRDSVPVAATSDAFSVTFACVALTYEVVRPAPFTLMAVVGTKPVPVTAMTSEEDPTTSVVGESEEITGAGLSTSKLAAVLPTVPLITTTERLPPLVSWLAGTMAVS